MSAALVSASGGTPAVALLRTRQNCRRECLSRRMPRRRNPPFPRPLTLSSSRATCTRCQSPVLKTLPSNEGLVSGHTGLLSGPLSGCFVCLFVYVFDWWILDREILTCCSTYLCVHQVILVCALISCLFCRNSPCPIKANLNTKYLVFLPPSELPETFVCISVMLLSTCYFVLSFCYFVFSL